MGKMTKVEGPDKCSMCGIPAERANGKVIKGMYGVICKECVKKCMDIHQSIDSKEKPSAKAVEPGKVRKTPTPREIKGFLDQHVIGQDSAKKTLSVAVSSHYSRIFRQNEIPKGHRLESVEVGKSTVLLAGPTGCGKTMLSQTLARMIDVPITIGDATSFTEAGFVGDDLSLLLRGLYHAADGDLAKAELGIVVLDECDKLASKSVGVNLTKDPSGTGVQEGLLRMMEGSVVQVPLTGNRKHPGAEGISFDTKNVLWILSGAFVGLDKVVENRIRGKGILGFGGDTKIEKPKNFRVEPEDLIAYGLIPELVGRISAISSLNALTKPDLLRILTEPQNALTLQFEKLAMIGGATLKFKSDALEEVANIALARRTGARGLRAVLDDVMMPILFDLEPGQDIVITAKDVVKAFSGDGVAA